MVVSDIDADAAERVASEIRDGGAAAEGIKLDVADESAWMAVIEDILSRYQRLDVLVNNAGSDLLGSVHFNRASWQYLARASGTDRV